MLIVIVIIGILAAALIPRLQSVQWRARDTKRKTDLKQIFSANEIHLFDNGVYARPHNANLTSGAYDMFDVWPNSQNTQPRISWLATYMTSIPVDPINDWATDVTAWYYGGTANPVFNTWNFSYMYSHVLKGWTTYDLTAALENRQDPGRCAVRLYLRRTTTTGSTSWCVGSYTTRIYEYSPDSNSF